MPTIRKSDARKSSVKRNSFKKRQAKKSSFPKKVARAKELLNGAILISGAKKAAG